MNEHEPRERITLHDGLSLALNTRAGYFTLDESAVSQASPMRDLFHEARSRSVDALYVWARNGATASLLHAAGFALVCPIMELVPHGTWYQNKMPEIRTTEVWNHDNMDDAVGNAFLLDGFGFTAESAPYNAGLLHEVKQQMVLDQAKLTIVRHPDSSGLNDVAVHVTPLGDGPITGAFLSRMNRVVATGHGSALDLGWAVRHENQVGLSLNVAMLESRNAIMGLCQGAGLAPKRVSYFMERIASWMD